MVFAQSDQSANGILLIIVIYRIIQFLGSIFMSSPPDAVDFHAALPHDIVSVVRAALREDVGDGDKTAALLKPSSAEARVVCRQDAVLCGTVWFDEVFRQIDPDIVVSWQYHDGAAISVNDVLCSIHGSVSGLLSGERTALNFVQLLSATATATRRCVRAISHTGCVVLDTRKTIPGLRSAQKYAVRCGGGSNHRMGLFDAILIKENHIAAVGSVRGAVSAARERFPGVFVEVEVEDLDEFKQAMAAEPDRILLDNFSVEQLKVACRLNRGRCQLEASGGITSDNVAAVAETGVNYLSSGSITKHVQAVDLSLRICR